MENSACGIDLEDGCSKLLDFRFADDLLLFARSRHGSDLLFAGDLLLFARSALLCKQDLKQDCVGAKRPPRNFKHPDLPRSRFGTIFMLETLMEELAFVGLCRSAGKTLVLINGAQPPKCFILTNQDAINCCKRQRCWTQMVGLYFVSWGLWNVNFGHHLSFTGRLNGILCQQRDSL